MPTPAERLALRQLHSTHSFFADAIVPLAMLSEQAGAPKAAGRIRVSGIGGSTAKQRWEATSGFAGAGDAKVLMSGCDIFGVTEAFWGDRIPDPSQTMTPEAAASVTESIDYLSRFVRLAREQGAEGRGAEVILYAPWTSPGGRHGDQYQGLVNSDPLWQHLTDGIEAGTGYRPQVIPAYQMIRRLLDDIAAGDAPGLTTPDQLFRDKLGHATPVALYGLGALIFAVIYGADPRGLPPLAVAPYAALPREQVEYLQRIAWEIAAVPAAPVETPPRPKVIRIIRRAILRLLKRLTTV